MALTTPLTHHAVSNTQSSEVVSLLGVYRTRIRSARRRRYLAMAALGVGAAWLLAALVHYFNMAVSGTFPAAILLTILLPITALVVESIRKPSLSDTAALIDRRLDNSQRLVTSVELMMRHETAPLTGAQIATSAHILSRLQPKVVYPTRTPWSMVAIGAGLLLLAVSLYVLKGGGFSPLIVGALPPDQPVASALAAPTADAGLPPSELTPEPTPTPVQEEVALDGSSEQQPPETEGEQQTTDPSQSGDPSEQAAASQQAESDLSRLSRALDGQSVTQQAADALKQGDTEQAAQQLTELGKENDQVSEEAKDGLADALDQAAQETDNNRILQKAEEQAARALRDGDYAEVDAAMQQLAEAMKQTAANVVPQQELAKSFPEQPAQSPSEQQPGDQSADGSQGSQSPEESSDGQEGQQDGQSEEEQQAGGGGTDDQSGEGEGNQQDAQGGGAKPESGEGGGQSGAPGQGTRVDGPKDPTDLDVPGNPFELEAQPDTGSSQPQTDPQQERPGLTLDGGAGGSGAAPVAPGEAINLPGETGNVPLDRWDIIRKFFTPVK